MLAGFGFLVLMWIYGLYAHFPHMPRDCFLIDQIMLSFIKIQANATVSIICYRSCILGYHSCIEGLKKNKYSVTLSTYHGKQIKLPKIVRQLRKGENDGQ